ncbi:hypothetical protein M422DRAFT_264963 [Sphaerobolus stellatus SS14]|uniref:DUF6533 domain-containing protein n=1 Tax=Sphaerobolus stellatus (strain SS14) TaxID=990650 RepID=A0A0C9TS62_SPHS4|nr:hypothetical protein M422DRAFT_264963 [Sphaerobolus stellatus SS14]
MESVAELIARVPPLRIAQYSLASVFTLLVYDYAITFGAEVASIWKSRFSFVKLLFLMNRYIGFTVVAIDVIIIFKPGLTSEIHALYGQNWKVTGALFLPIAIWAIACGTIDYSTQAKASSPPPPLQGCYISSLPHRGRFVWVPPLFTEISLCFAMIYKAWTLWPERDLRNVLAERTISPLLRRIILDSILYFFSILMILLMNTTIWLVAPLDYTYIGIPWAEAIPCIMGSRLLLNIREHYVQDTTKVSGVSTEMVLRPFQVRKQYPFFETIDISVTESTIQGDI